MVVHCRFTQKRSRGLKNKNKICKVKKTSHKVVIGSSGSKITPTMLNIEKLPDEIIINILSYLPLQDRKNTRLVCKLWRSLNYTLSLIKDDITSTKDYLLLDKCISPNVRHVNVRTKIVQGTKRTIKFWSKCGENIKSIEIFRIDVFNEVLIDIFENCPNLEFLSLSSWDENDTPRSPLKGGISPRIPYSKVNLPKLLSLDLMHMAMLNAEALQILTENANCLKRISLEWWRPINPDPLVLDALSSVIKRQSNVLKELNLSHSHITDAFVKQIVRYLGSQLTGLYLQWCDSLTDDCLSVIGKKLVNLKELDIGRCSFTQDGLFDLFPCLKNLTLVCLKKTKQLTDETVASLEDLPNLKGLDLSECVKITNVGLSRLFREGRKPKMIDLRLSKLREITDIVIMFIAPKLPNLKFLYLNGCVKLTDSSLRSIFQHNQLLRCFSMQDCPRVTSLTEGRTINSLKGLIHLDLFGCRNMLAVSVRSIRLQELQTADLSDVWLSADDICSIIKGCPSLQYLYLDDGLSRIKKQLPNNGSGCMFRWGYARFEPDSLFD